MKAMNVFIIPNITYVGITLKKYILVAMIAMVGIIVAGSGFISARSLLFLTDDCDLGFGFTVHRCDIVREFVHDHSLDSPKAVAFHKIIESDRLTFQDRIILDSIGKHELSPAKKLFFTKALDEDEVALKKKMIFNVLHEFDHHNFHDPCHKAHNNTSLNLKGICD